MTDTTHDDFHPATAGDDPIWLGGVEYITKQRSADLVQAAVAAALREAINRVNGCDRISEVQPAILALIREGGE